MSAITIPEVVIYNTLDALLRFMRNDLKANEDAPQNSVLYAILGETEDGHPLKMNAYNFFDQAKKILTTQGYLSINYGYSGQTAKNISLHIMLPSETFAGSGIGEDEGYLEDPTEPGLSKRFTQNFEANYQIMITSDNNSEVMTMYHLLKSLMLAVVPHWELMGIRLPRFSGSDVVFEQDLVPFMTFHKVINITFMYEHTVPQLLWQSLVTGIIFDGTPQPYIQSPPTQL